MASPALPAFPALAVDPDFCAALSPGDILLYARTGFYSRLISIKTWSRITHCEVALPFLEAPRLVAASRNGQGCGFYAFDPSGLALVLRPKPVLPQYDAGAVAAWMKTERITEQGYDWLGLLNFSYARLVGKDNRKMFCSEFAVRAARKAGHVREYDYFPEQDADTIAPGEFCKTPALTVVWRSPDEWARYHTNEGDWT